MFKCQVKTSQRYFYSKKLTLVVMDLHILSMKIYVDINLEIEHVLLTQILSYSNEQKA